MGLIIYQLRWCGKVFSVCVIMENCGLGDT